MRASSASIRSLKASTDTNWLPGAEYRVPIAPIDNPVLTVVPGFVAYPPELAYPPTPNTNIPPSCFAKKARARLAYISGDVERSMWVSGHTDLSRFLQNIVKWLVRDEQPATIQGPGLIETFAYETEPGFALHVLNYTNPNLHRGTIRAFYPIGPQIGAGLRFLPEEPSPAFSCSSRRPTFRSSVSNGGIEFTIPSVTEYEVAAIYA